MPREGLFPGDFVCHDQSGVVRAARENVFADEPSIGWKQGLFAREEHLNPLLYLKRQVLVAGQSRY